MTDAEIQKVDAFKKELLALCDKHGLVAVPSYEGTPSAHDPLVVIEMDEFWRKYIQEELYDGR